MTQQEIVERDVRMTIGDLHVQLIVARAQVAELQQKLDAAVPPQKLDAAVPPEPLPEQPKAKANGKTQPEERP